MLHDGSEPAGAPFLLGTVDVTSPAHQFDLPSTATSPTGPARLEASIALAGYEFHRLDSALSLNLYWRTDAPMMTRYKIFAQLLAADNTLVAQSDSFPAAGQRPTTGWLPGEIISDPHTLVLPPDPVPGSYRLIAGLYNPLTGERLPLLDEHGNPVADAIFIAEVTVP
jgi:hypothetical protein